MKVDDVVFYSQEFTPGMPLNREVRVVQIPNIGPHATAGHVCVEALTDEDGFDRGGVRYKRQWWVEAKFCMPL